MCSGAKRKIKEAYTQLTNLSVTAMSGSLYAKEVITLKQKQQINSIPIESDKMEYLLDEIIIPSLLAGKIEKFRLFLEVMEQSDDPLIKTVARDLGMYIIPYVNPRLLESYFFIMTQFRKVTEIIQ